MTTPVLLSWECGKEGAEISRLSGSSRAFTESGEEPVTQKNLNFFSVSLQQGDVPYSEFPVPVPPVSFGKGTGILAGQLSRKQSSSHQINWNRTDGEAASFPLKNEPC